MDAPGIPASKCAEEQEYFHGFIRKEDAAAILKEPGEFLLRCELVKGAPVAVAEGGVPGAVSTTTKYVLSVLVQPSPDKTTVAEWEIVTEPNQTKWHVIGVFDQALFFDTIDGLVEHYCNPDNNAELPTVDTTDCLRSGMSRVGEAPVATVEKAKLTKCVKKAKWEVKATDVTVLDGPENLLGAGNFGSVRRGFIRRNGADIAVAIKIAEIKKKPEGSQKGAKSEARSTKSKVKSARSVRPSAENTCEKTKEDQASIKASTRSPAPSANDIQLIADTLKEAAAMRHIDHPHVIKLYGVVVEKPPIMMIIELVNSNSLKSFLTELDGQKPPQKLTPEQSASLAVQASWGVEYLHSKHVIHRDISARNCLLHRAENDWLTLKISDFGMSKVGESYHMRSNASLPVKWMAPEAVLNQRFSNATDVWSFGCMLYELYTMGRVPLGNVKTPDLKKSFKLGVMPQEIPPEFPPHANESISACWIFDPADRAIISDIARILEKFTNLNPPVKVARPSVDERAAARKKVTEQKTTPKKAASSKKARAPKGSQKDTRTIGGAKTSTKTAGAKSVSKKNKRK